MNLPEVSLSPMNADEFVHYSTFSYNLFLQETARASGKSVDELRKNLGGPPSSMRPADRWILISCGYKSIGYLWVEILPNQEAFGWDIYIDEAHRSQGLGKQVMLSAGEILKKDQVYKIRICVLEDNLIARRLYSALGFQEIHFNEVQRRFTLEAFIC